MSATLTATAGTLTATATIGIPLPITVTGTVLFEDGLPAVSASVAIGSQSTTTDSRGNFTISNVAAPYDLVSVISLPASLPGSPSKTGMMYQGLTRANPTITFIGFSPLLPNSGQVTGTISGGDPGEVTYVAFGAPETTAFGGTGDGNTFVIGLFWSGPASTTGTVHALQYSANSGVATAYKAYGAMQDVTVTNGGTTTQDITMTPVTSASLSGTISVPPSYFLLSKQGYVTFDDGSRIPIISDTSFNSNSTTLFDFNYLTPSGLGTITLLAQGGGTNGSDVGLSLTYLFGLSPSATDTSMLLQPAPQQLNPANMSPGITTATDFTWTAFTDGISLVQVIPQGTYNAAYSIVTAGTTTTIPDLSAFGLGLQSGGATYNWQVYGFAPFENVDAFAGGHTIFPSDATVFYEGSTSERTFTTQ